MDRYKEVVTVNSKSRNQRESFSLSLPTILLMGLAVTAAFYALIITGPLDTALLRRYCLGHPVAIASVGLFFVGLITLLWKWTRVLSQNTASAKATVGLRRIIAEGADVTPADRPEWLLAHLQNLSDKLQTSWFATRVSGVLALQVSRGRRHYLESDIKSASESEADRQYDSYSLLRIINWAMPMLGFLGTVLGISQTLGQLDTQLLATQQQEAMNQLTAGLYVAFDTTAIALILTVCSMFLQFGVSRIELSLLAKIDQETNQNLIEFLAADPFDSHDKLLVPIREMTTELVSSLEQLVEQQASIWKKSIDESQQQWADWSLSAASRVDQELGTEIKQSLVRHVDDLRQLQDDGYRQVDIRWQQWQTTLSDQARVIQGQQKEVARQSESLQHLVESTTDLRKLEEVIQESVSRLENINRLEEATICVGEAVAVLAASLERAKVIRGTPLKPRPARSPGSEDSVREASAPGDDGQSPSIESQRRKAA